MIINFFKNRYHLFLTAILFFVIIFSLSRLTTSPRVWFDEGLNIEIAHNFLLFYRLDIFTAPGIFSGAPHAVGTSGYPLILPLAGVFSLFGFGLEQARIYMFFWLIITLLSVYYVVKSVFGVKKALATAAFIATFAPFYNNGLTVFGEVPGFFFLLWGLFFMIKPEKPNYWLTGLFFSLAGVTKPYLLLLFPVFLIFLFLKERKDFFKIFFKFTLSTIPFLLAWTISIFPNPFSLKIWQEAFLFNKYHFGKEFSIVANILKNISLVFTHSTLIYFLLFFLAILFWYFKGGKENPVQRKWCNFLFIYSIFSFLYFLVSPGWLRYFLIFELLIFVFAPSVLENITNKLFKNEKLQRVAFMLIIIFLLIVQLFQLFVSRHTYSSPYPEIIASFINKNLERDDNYRVGIINTPEIAWAIDSSKKFHIVKVGGPSGIFGENPLAFSQKSLPKFIAFYGDNYFTQEYDNVLKENYFPLKLIGGYFIYELK